uniref:Uncharacterized protein n=1 Tax=Lepeophtheirus salmonis TaxID=72036 RepID=A0A0K2UUI3_LEPSM
MQAQLALQSDLQESISRRIHDSKQELDHLTRKIGHLQNEVEKEVENCQIAEEGEFRIKSVVQGLESRNSALQQDISEVLESRREVDIELEALNREITNIRVDESSRIMSMGQECFDSFLQQFKNTTEINNNMNESSLPSENCPKLKESSDILNREIDELEAELSKEYSELRQQILKVEEHIKSVKNKIGQVKVSPTTESCQTKVKKFQRDKIDLSGEVVRLEQEYETLKLRTGRSCRLLMKK